MVSWYFLFGLECYLNGGYSFGPGLFKMHIGCLKQDLYWILPSGRRRSVYITLKLGE